ncbi:hypothetical protein EW093_06895 [Thiospirochaeta perfilievii]|uniref:DUF4292 domain-containing protein n=1 Tax=Thiospirochaeta perfilievii TaxID=252967 RepID=A0A5C1Q8Q3_9SPIO|nr:hypothetical protein [Thiospirochaeta perfilievii]QEN04435.1 hypothetical protein EW093_06895 [Thiospirochaeta perfilievii]
MKKVMCCYVLLSVVIIMSCQQETSLSNLESSIGQQLDPVSIAVKSGSIEDIKSFSADVTVYSGNNREIGGITEEQRYRLSVKEIDGIIHSRIDYPTDMFSDGIARSCITNERDLFIFQSTSNKLEQRYELNLLEPEMGFEVFDSMNKMFIQARIPNFINFKTQLYDLTKDITVDEESNTLLVNIPSNNLKLTFDLIDELLIGSESEEILEDGTNLTTTTEYVYQEVDGEMLKIGEITESKYDLNKSIDASDYGLPIIESEENIEEMSLEEIDDLENEGGLAYEVIPVIGDPSDLDYIETEIQLYSEIDINSVDESLLRIEW